MFKVSFVQHSTYWSCDSWIDELKRLIDLPDQWAHRLQVGETRSAVTWPHARVQSCWTLQRGLQCCPLLERRLQHTQLFHDFTSFPPQKVISFPLNSHAVISPHQQVSSRVHVVLSRVHHCKTPGILNRNSMKSQGKLQVNRQLVLTGPRPRACRSLRTSRWR